MRSALPGMPEDRSQNLVRSALQLLALGGLILASLWIVRPFVVATVWASVLAVSTWPLLLSVQAYLFDKRSLAIFVMTSILLVVLLLPFYLAITGIAANVEQLSNLKTYLANPKLPALPSWLLRLPIVGESLAARWRELALAGPDELHKKLEPLLRTLTMWFLTQVGSISLLLVQIILTVIITAILYSKGEDAGRTVENFIERLTDSTGHNILRLATNAIRGVALGVVVTAVLQTFFAGIGLVVVGVPFAAILTGAMFILAIAQVGPAPILIGAVVWTYAELGAIWGTSLLIWSIGCCTFDNILRPFLIKRGADLPLLLIFTGVIGGLISFGAIGLFIGPVVLAIAYSLLAEWLSMS
jgi:predicted PurR-regulated permease PerM